MRNYTYNFETSTMITQFMAAMDDIVVKRYNQDQSVADQLEVRFLYAPKERVLADLTDKAQTIQLPVISTYIGGISRDPNRVFNKVIGSYYNSGELGNLGLMPQPVPINLTLNMMIWTRYQKDMDQIVSNFVPYFDPYIEVSWKIPAMNDFEIRSKIVWNSNINFTYPFDINSSQVARIQAETSFTIEGWLYKSMTGQSTNKIFTTYANINTVDSLSAYSI